MIAAGANDFLTHGGVCQRDDLIMTGKQDFMLTNNCSAADSMDADFIFASCSTAAVAVVDILRSILKFFRNGISKHQCGAAWSVHLAVVVFFDDFDIKIVTQHFSSFFASQSEGYTQRHVGREKDRDGFCSLMGASTCSGESPVVAMTAGILCFTA